MTPEEFINHRAELGFSQSELAAAFGIHHDTVSRWERGTRAIPAHIRLAFAALEAKTMDTYAIEIRDGKGAVLAEGQSRAAESWQEATIRVAHDANLPESSGRIGSHQYFRTAQGAPYGTHHVQFGERRQGGAVSLGRRYVVHVG